MEDRREIIKGTSLANRALYSLEQQLEMKEMKIADLERRRVKDLEAIKVKTAQCKTERNVLAEAMGCIAEVVTNILARDDASGAKSPNYTNVW